MKVLLLFALFIASCGVSKEDKNDIEFYINLHNLKVKQRFVSDSIEEDTRLKISMIGIDKQLQRKRLESHGPVFANEWNQPYTIQRDRFLTYDKYMDYCKANGKDPKTFYKFMD